MKYSQAKWGRIFTVRLEDGDVVHTCLEELAAEKGIQRAAVILLGGVDKGSTLIVGPEKGRERPVNPMEFVLDNVHEVAGVGTIFPNEAGRPVVHMHAACGREGATVSGCIRAGVTTWQVGEAVIMELTDNRAIRKKDPSIGFELLDM